MLTDCVEVPNEASVDAHGELGAPIAEEVINLPQADGIDDLVFRVLRIWDDNPQIIDRFSGGDVA